MSTTDYNLDCRGCQSAIERFLTGQLDTTEADAVEQHLESCKMCARQAEKSLAMDARLSEAFGMAVMTPSETESLSISAITKTAITGGTALRRRRHVIQFAGAMTAAAAVLVAAFFIYPLLSSPGDQPVEEPIVAGLHWLAQNQEDDGHWDSRRHGAKTDFDLGLTALSTLALTVNEETDQHPELEQARDRGLRWLLSRQRPDGLIESTQNNGAMYGHAIATLALTEAYARNVEGINRRDLQRAVDYCGRTQLAGGGWSYQRGMQQATMSDTSHTGWFVLALVRADNVRLNVPKRTLAGARNWIARVTDGAGNVGYQLPGQGTAATNAIGVMVVEVTDKSGTDSQTFKPRQNLRQLLAEKKPAKMQSLYFWHFASRLPCQDDLQANGKWTDKLARQLIDRQKRNSSPDRGSWDNTDTDSRVAGRVYSTALTLVTLDELRGR